MNEIDLITPDDWHVHLRDGALLGLTAGLTAGRFARAIVMPNLGEPVTTTDAALAYRERILAALPAGTEFEPLMTLYLTEETSPKEIRTARASGCIHGVKLYPAGATTHSAAGVTDLKRVYPVLEMMEEQGMVLQVHGEVVDPEVDTFDREAVFIERHLEPLVTGFAGLKIVFEHITTREAVAFVRDAPANVAATITAHHLLLNRTAMFTGGIRPHVYCLPVLKREVHRRALVAAATAGDPKFFLGTDSAPHARHAKESDCGCAGVMTAHAALEFYAEVFDAAGALERLEGFASCHGADFYGLARNRSRITLNRRPREIPAELPYDGGTVVPLRAGGHVDWTVVA